MADTDLTQYNGTPSFPATADVGTGTDPYLVPTDGKLITALSNLINEAPANRSLQRVKDLLLGLRGAVLGDFLGAVQKSFKSIYVDGTGGITQTVTAGYTQTLTAFLVGAFGATRASLDVKQLNFSGTIASGSNPVATAAGANALDALMIPKAWVRWETDGVGGITLIDGGRIASVALPGASGVRINFATNFDNANYAYSSVVWKVGVSMVVDYPTTITNSHTIINCGLDPATNNLQGMQIFFGRQTT